MQTDGTFVMYSGNFAAVPWSTGTFGRNGAIFEIKNDGNMVVRTGSTIWWQSFTGGH